MVSKEMEQVMQIGRRIYGNTSWSKARYSTAMALQLSKLFHIQIASARAPNVEGLEDRSAGQYVWKAISSGGSIGSV